MELKDMSNEDINKLKSDFTILQQTIDNLKCCGNCPSFYHNHKCSMTTGNGYCDKWQSDNMTRKDREVV